jgi:enoyl-CoA hydratase/carnithine racemase
VRPCDTMQLIVGGPIATFTIDRPDAANMLCRAVHREGVDAVDSIANDDQVRLLVITGVGSRRFSGDVDLREFARIDVRRCAAQLVRNELRRAVGTGRRV